MPIFSTRVESLCPFDIVLTSDKTGTGRSQSQGTWSNSLWRSTCTPDAKHQHAFRHLEDQRQTSVNTILREYGQVPLSSHSIEEISLGVLRTPCPSLCCDSSETLTEHTEYLVACVSDSPTLKNAQQPVIGILILSTVKHCRHELGTKQAQWRGRRVQLPHTSGTCVSREYTLD
jgi:hypothetical protein